MACSRSKVCKPLHFFAKIDFRPCERTSRTYGFLPQNIYPEDMMAMDRFFLYEPPCRETATLTDEEAHHLLHVLRGRPGEQVTLFDGHGCEYTAEIISTTRRDVQLRVLESRMISRERAVPLTLAVTLPKGERQKWLVEKLTELGVTRLIPLATQRSVATVERGTLAKLRRGVIEASKQCRRNWLMEITEPMTWQTFLSQCSSIGSHSRLRWWIAHPLETADPLTALWTKSESDGEIGGENPAKLADSAYSTPSMVLTNSQKTVESAELGRESMESALSRGVVAAVGPEGGFTDEEVSAAIQLGFRPLSLGARILRIETAAIAIAAVEPPV